MAAPTALAPRPQHRHGRGPDCAESDRRAGALSRARTGQRCPPERDLRDHHASRVLRRVGERHGHRADRARCLRHARGLPLSIAAAAPPLLPLDQAAEAQRAALVEATVGPVAPGLVAYTRDVLFKDLWLRPALAPRDRSLVTVSALIASGQVAQVTFHLNRAMDSGLTREEAGEVIAHLAFYAGWPNAFSAVPWRRTCSTSVRADGGRSWS